MQLDSYFKNLGMGSAITLIILSLLVASCGGGGGGGAAQDQPDPVDPAPQPPISTPDPAATQNTIAQRYRQHMNFAFQPALGLINADSAYGYLEATRGTGTSNPAQAPTIRPGAGVKIGVIDGGLDLRHISFEGISIRSFFSRTGNNLRHGTGVTSVMASAPQASRVRSAYRFGGVAWGAEFSMYAIPLGTADPDRPYQALSPAAAAPWYNSYRNRFLRAFRDKVDFLNLSLAYDGLIEFYDESALRASLQSAFDLYAQKGATDKTVLVFAAGNANSHKCRAGTRNCVCATPNCQFGELRATSPEFTSAFMVHIPELRSHTVAVVAVDSEGPSAGVISDFSNRCGIAKNWCIAAPGKRIRVATVDVNSRPVLQIVNGTSFAAPFVVGGLAVMKQMFRGQLSNTALLTRLYATANKSGIYADRDIYGQGLMDLGAATGPQGQQTVAVGQWVSDGGFDLLGTELKLGRALGDGFRQAVGSREMVVFDRLGAPFWYELSSLVQNRSASHPLSERLYRWNQRVQSRTSADAALSFATDFWGDSTGSRKQDGRFEIGLLRTRFNSEIGPLSLAENAVGLNYEDRGGGDFSERLCHCPHQRIHANERGRAGLAA